MTLTPQPAWAERFAEASRAPHDFHPAGADRRTGRQALRDDLSLPRSAEGPARECVELPDGDVMMILRRTGSSPAVGLPEGAPSLSVIDPGGVQGAEAAAPRPPELVLRLRGVAATGDERPAGQVLLMVGLGDVTLRALTDACGPQGLEDLGCEVFSLPAPQRHAQVVRDILCADLPGRLRTSYLAAKGAELVCLTLASAATQALRAPSVKLRRADLVRTEQARRLLHQELNAPPRLDRLARRVGLNRSKLAACFKHLYGCGVYEYSRRERLLLGRRLLIESEASVLQIAAATGYETIASFSKSFRAEFGMSPRACRAEGRQCA